MDPFFQVDEMLVKHSNKMNPRQSFFFLRFGGRWLT